MKFNVLRVNRELIAEFNTCIHEERVVVVMVVVVDGDQSVDGDGDGNGGWGLIDGDWLVHC